MATGYLPAWATLQEATDWLQAATDEPWPLPRLLEAGLLPHIWLTPDRVSPAALSAVFGGRHEGFLAPLMFGGDTHRLSVERSGAMSCTRSPTGETVFLTPPAPFAADELRFSATELRETAALVTGKRATAPEEDDSALATREQLIAAFGAFTGMDAAWFDNLKDTPALLKARRVKGRGQRHSIEPLFCPMTVMLWLASKKRKKGRLFQSEGKPWELLERHFPAVYAKNSHGDPREDRPG